jgi:multidrug efflux pump
VGYVLARKVRFFLAYLLLFGAVAWLFGRIPESFLPEEDQGILMVEIQLPAGASTTRTRDVIARVEKYFLEEEKDYVVSIFTVAGFSFSGRGQNSAAAFVSLTDWDRRKAPESKVGALARRAMGAFRAIRDGNVYVMAPPAIPELGNANGFDAQLQDRASLGHEALMEARTQFLSLAYAKPELMRSVRPNGKSDTPDYAITIDRDKAFAQSIALPDIHDTLQTGWGGAYVNDFLDKGRIKRVYLQAEAGARMTPEDLEKWYVRSRTGEMTPLSSVITGRWGFGSPRLERYNGLPSAEIVGEPAPGVSTGDVMAAVEDIVRQLPEGIGLEWTGLSLQEKESGEQTTRLYLLSVLVVFLSLAALYESWSVPIAVLLVLPVGILGVEAAALMFGQKNDVYFQVGFLTIVGLSAKNAILIVEFAKTLHEGGRGLLDATIEACRLRLRPILMTSLAFILGVMPLAISSGAGSGSQNAIGIGVVGGMLSVTFIGIFFIPLFFVVVWMVFHRPTCGTLPPTCETLPPAGGETEGGGWGKT